MANGSHLFNTGNNNPLDNSEPIDVRDLRHNRVLSNLQGNIIKGHGRDYTVHFFVHFSNDRPDEVKKWIADFAEDKLTSCKEQLRQRELFKRHEMPGALFAGLYFTKFFYEDFFGKASLEKFTDKAFTEGMKSRRDKLNDSAPCEWEPGFQGELRQDKLPIHAMILLAHDDVIELGKAAKVICEELDPPEAEDKKTEAKKAKAKKGIQVKQTSVNQKQKFADVLTVEYGSAIRNSNLDGLEHFGYVDGISQPLFLKDEIEKYWEAQSFMGDEKDSKRFNPFAPLDLVLVNDPCVPDEKAEAYGSYFVFRKLEQYVRNFKRAEKALADSLGLEGEDDERMGAMIVGRYEDGTPLTLSNEEKMIGSGVMNNFDYNETVGGVKGDDGSRCPFHAHIRKVNLRNDADRKHRMARRGITYGHRNVSTTIENHFVQMPESGVGLLFMSFQKSIENQFEALQRRANGIGDDKGLDLLIGQLPPVANSDGMKSKAQIEEEQQKRRAAMYPRFYNSNQLESLSFPEFIQLRGGEYFFAPSVTYLKGLFAKFPSQHS